MKRKLYRIVMQKSKRIFPLKCIIKDCENQSQLICKQQQCSQRFLCHQHSISHSHQQFYLYDKIENKLVSQFKTVQLLIEQCIQLIETYKQNLQKSLELKFSEIVNNLNNQKYIYPEKKQKINQLHKNIYSYQTIADLMKIMGKQSNQKIVQKLKRYQNKIKNKIQNCEKQVHFLLQEIQDACLKKIFKFSQKNTDKSGLIYWLGTQFINSNNYRNVANLGLISCLSENGFYNISKMNSNGKHNLQIIFNYKHNHEQTVATNPTRIPYFQFKFNMLKLCPTHIILTNKYGSKKKYLQGLSFQGFDEEKGRYENLQNNIIRSNLNEDFFLNLNQFVTNKSIKYVYPIYNSMDKLNTIENIYLQVEIFGQLIAIGIGFQDHPKFIQ